MHLNNLNSFYGLVSLSHLVPLYVGLEVAPNRDLIGDQYRTDITTSPIFTTYECLEKCLSTATVASTAVRTANNRSHLLSDDLQLPSHSCGPSFHQKFRDTCRS
eukprot:s523_g14.t1